MSIWYGSLCMDSLPIGNNMTINKIKKEINKVIKKENLTYCEICYDGECENDKNIWFYDLIVYDTEEKINKLILKLKTYAEINILKNIDDGDYTIECTIRDDKNATKKRLC